MTLEWMAWTPYTAGLFIAIGLTLVGMTIWQVVSPSVERRGLLPIRTSRGDRLFIGLLGGAYITLAWIGLSDWSLWWVLPVVVVFIALVIRYG